MSIPSRRTTALLAPGLFALGLAAVLPGCTGDPLAPGAGGAGGSGGSSSSSSSAGATGGVATTSGGGDACAGVSCALAQASGQDPPILFNVSPTAQPGDVIGLQGARFTAAATVSLAVIGATAPETVNLQVLTGSDGHLAALVPGDLAAGLYAVSVSEGGRTSAPVLVNQPRIDHVEFDELAPDSTFRLFGRNLAGSRVSFLGPDKTGIPASVTASEAYTLTARAPAGLQPGTTYAIEVETDSQLACGCRAVIADETVTGRAGGTDPFGVGAPWGADFTFAGNPYDVLQDPRLSLHAKGDGVADDTAALQAALDRAHQDGGGVVLLPAGTYRLAGSTGLVIRSRVVLAGAGQDKTQITYGFVPPAPFAWGLLFAEGGALAGVASLRLENVDKSGSWGRNLNSYGPWSKVFFKDVTIDEGGGGPIWMGDINGFVIADSTVLSVQSTLASGDAGNSGPFIINGPHFWMRNTTTSWNVGGAHFDGLDHAVFEGSSFLRDGNKHTVENTRGVQLNFARRVAMLGNHFTVAGADNLTLNDGETIMSEGGGPLRRDADTAAVSSATTTTLVDASKAWKALEAGAEVVIVTGSASGEHRRIVSRDETTITVDPPWDVVPEAGAHFAVTNWGAERWLLKDNDLTRCARGIMLYWSSADRVAIVHNTLTDSSGIWLQPAQTVQSNNVAYNNFTPLFDVVIADNEVKDPTGLTGAFIAIDFTADTEGDPGYAFGTAGYGIEVRRNDVVGTTPNTPTVPGYHPYSEGYTAQATFAKPADQAGKPPALLGTIFQGNRAENSHVGFRTATGDLDTIVWSSQLVNVMTATEDVKTNNASQASTNTVIGP